MIAVYDFLYLRLQSYGQKYQIGLDITNDFNSRLAEVQSEVFNQFLPYYSANEQIRLLLSPWVITLPATNTSNTGALIIPNLAPNSYCRIISLFVNINNINYAVYSVQENELGIIQHIPQRRPDITKKQVYYLDNNVIQLYPQQQLNVSGFYFVYPSLAKIAFTEATVNGEDTQVVDRANVIDLGWNQSAANIILYKMLEKYGISVREDLLREYANLGLSEAEMKGAQAA